MKMNKHIVGLFASLAAGGQGLLRGGGPSRGALRSPLFPVSVRRVAGLTTSTRGLVTVSASSTQSSATTAASRTREESPNIVRSVWPEVTIPEVSIPEYIFREFDKHGKRPALINGLTGEVKSFIEVKDAAWRIASGLSRLGFKRRDKLLVISENSVEYILTFYAVVWIGGTITMVNPHYLSNDIARQGTDSEASYILTSKHCAPKSLEVAGLLKNQIKKVIVVGEASGCLPFSVLMSDDGSSFPENIDLDPRSDVALLPFSSGTTGLPKGVMLTHYNMVSNAIQTDIYSDPQPFLEKESMNLGLLPFYHIYAILISFLGSLAMGQTTVVIPEFNPQMFLDLIKKYKISLTYVVPPIVLFLNKHPMATQADLSSLKRIICAAAPLPVEMIKELHQKRPHCIIGQGYGMTETSPAISVNPVPACYTKPASSGLPLPNTSIKIHDGNTGSTCETGMTGEVCVKGPQVMLGYLNNKKATDEMIDPDGWLHTGDIGYVDEQGYLYIVDRVKELIKYKGLQVPPAELEAILCSHDAVADAAVIGLPDPEAGELPKAYVSLKPGSSATPEELEKFVSSKVVSYKRLRGGVSFLRQIPRSPSGKILRRDLKLAATKPSK